MNSNRLYNEWVAREVMGWVGAKPMNGEHPWDAGVRPEDSEFDGKSAPTGGTYPFFTYGPDDNLIVFGEKGKMGDYFNPAQSWASAGLVVEKLLGGQMKPTDLIQLAMEKSEETIDGAGKLYKVES